MKFSLIVPVYNVEKYLDKCLNSIFSNDYKNYEVIIVNDGSKDNSEEIINKYIEMHDNIIYVKQKNQGLSAARNEGVKRSTGDYIVFIDSDDYIECDFLKIISSNLNDKPDLLRYQVREVYENKIENIYEDGFDLTNGIDAFNKIVKYKYIEMSQLYIYKSSYYKDNKFKFQKGIYHEDFNLIPIIISKAKSIKSIDYIGYNYLQREGSIMSSNDKEKVIKKMDDTILSFNNAISILNNSVNTENIKHYYANTTLYKYNLLDRSIKRMYKNKIKELKIFDYLMNNNLKRRIKKFIYKIKFAINL
ncbi:MAG: glycosyltransferase [Bacilli bacterium]|nr:glycosyltransferase [Bacilli bacterium]